MSSLILFKIGRNLDFIIKTGEIVASPHYIDMTNHVVVKFHEDDVVAEFNLDPDYSTACYYWLYSLIHKKEIWIRSVGEIIQPDYSFFWLLYKYGAKIKDKKGLITLDTNNELPLTKTEILIEMNEMPDQIITLAFLCLVGGMTVKMTGCKILFYKESDRINGIIENIKLMGGKAEYDLTKDELNVSPLFKEPLKCTLKTYNDHRFALTFLVLQKKYPQLSIDNVDCIYKSVDPSFNFFK
jgi:3-phosphoshikimate 1-carboxyvinyltransferase